MEFEKEKKFVIDALGKNHRLASTGFRDSLDELYNLFQYRKQVILDRTTGDAILLSLYLSAKRACHSVHMLKAVTEELVIDPFNLPYRKYAEKFRKLIDEFGWWAHIHTSTLAPFWDGLGLIENEDYERIYGAKKEALFDGESGGEDNPNVSKVTLNAALDTLLDHEWFLQKTISDCLEDIADTLEGIDDSLNWSGPISRNPKERLRKRKEVYMAHKQWTDDREELYNIIRMVCVNGMEKQMLPMVRGDLYIRLKRNRLGEVSLGDKNADWWESEDLGYTQPLTQTELNEYLRLSSQYELICKLDDYIRHWSVKDDTSLFANRGIEYKMNLLVPLLAKMVEFGPLKSYAALWEALIDLKMIGGTEAKYKNLFIDWVNTTFLKDKYKKFKDNKVLRDAVEDLYKLQTKEGVQRQFKDLTEEEISQLENGDTLKPLYEKCIHIIANSFMINLEEMNFQSYITKNTSIQNSLEKIPRDEKGLYILECQRAYEEFKRYEP